MITVESEPIPTAGSSPAKTWRAGTLAYTTPALVILFAWLLWGDFSWSMKERTVGPVLQLLLQKFSASDTLTGAMIGSLPLIVSMFLSPVISYKSDHHRGPWGRRIPFLLIPTPFAVLAMVGLAFSPALGHFVDQLLGPGSPGVNSITVLCLGSFWAIFEIATVIANSVFGGLINDVVPQAVLGRFFGAFRALSLIAGIIFSHWFFGKADQHYVFIFLAMGTLYGVGFMLMCWRVKEGEYPPPPPASPRPSIGTFLVAAKGFFQECFGIPYYWWFYGATAISWMSFMPFNLFSFYYAKQINMDLQTLADCSAVTYSISLLLAYPLGILADRLHPLRLALIVQAIYVVSTLASGFYVQGPQTFAVALVLHGVLSGTWMTAAASLGLRLLPRENFAQYASAAGIIGSLCGIVVGPSVGFLLDHIHHQYRATFFLSAGLATVAWVGGLVLYRQFVVLGGPRGYVAPRVEPGS